MTENQDKKPSKNYIKTRDDQKEYIRFQRIETLENTTKFELSQDSPPCSWLKDEQEFTERELRHRIEPWLTSLFQSEHLSLLVGSGLTTAVGYLAANRSSTNMEGVKFIDRYNGIIEKKAKDSAKQAGRKEGNIEDQIRVANELLRGLEILDHPDYSAQELEESIKDNLKSFAESVLKTEKNIATANEERRTEAWGILVNFLMSFASRIGTRDRLNIFTTNYDRLIEAGAEMAGLHLLDRFLGNLMPIFRSSRLDLDMHYNPPGIRGEPRYLEGVARFTKLHGSLDWVQKDKDIRRLGLPFGAEKIDPYLNAPGLQSMGAHKLMIYPNSTKDRETALYPYVELFRDFAAAICRPNNTLVTYGYSFGDEHINRIIEDMLTIPSTHLVIISYDDPLGRIIQTYEKISRPAQITLLIGDHLGDLKTLTQHYLPKSAIDQATSRMGELLRQRFDSQGMPKENQDTPKDNKDTEKSKSEDIK